MKIPRNSETYWYVVDVPPAPMEGKPLGGWVPCVEWCVRQWPEGETVSTRPRGMEYHYFDEIPLGGRHWRFVGNGQFEFRRREDLILFLLRWS